MQTARSVFLSSTASLAGQNFPSFSLKGKIFFRKSNLIIFRFSQKIRIFGKSNVTIFSIFSKGKIFGKSNLTYFSIFSKGKIF